MDEAKERAEEVARLIVDASVRVHRELGAGLFESTYQACLAHELRGRGLRVECEGALPVHYRGITIEAGYRVDMLVEDRILIENKSVQALLPIHEAQLLTYLPQVIGSKTGVSDQLERSAHEGWTEADGQQPIECDDAHSFAFFASLR